MNFEETEIKGCYLISPSVFEDDRGEFFRYFCENEFKKEIRDLNFVQFNQSINYKKGTFRGLHYQIPPFCEAKLVRCIRGSIQDFILDIREGSETFLKYLKIDLSEENKKILFICEGVAHGFQTLEDNTQLLYHHTEAFNKDADRGIKYNDPKVNIELALPISQVSEKDLNYPELKEFQGIKYEM